MIFFSLLIFQACGGSSDSGSSSTTGNSITTVLYDSVVFGVSYKCDNTENLTNEAGELTCNAGSTVSFSIGNIFLGSMTMPSSSVPITPAVLYGLSNHNISDTRVVNFLQLLQSLDEDNNASNGITISSTTREKLATYTLDISDTSTNESQISTLVLALSKTLVSVVDAINHYKTTLEDTLNIDLNPEPEPLFEEQWAINYDATFYIKNSINADAHIHLGNNLKTYSGNNVTIAIIDDGFDLNHDELVSSLSVSFNNEDLSTDVSQDNNEIHGTAVSGIIAARKNSIGMQGLAYNSNIVYIKYSDSATDSDTIRLFQKAEDLGADIINCSWGTGDVSDAVRDKIIELSNNGRNGKGTIIVFASGNDNEDLGNDESNIEEVISVGASNKFNRVTVYSNYGDNLDILAPGGEYLGITTLDPLGSDGIASNDENYLLYDDANRFVGTSASAPIVSGVIALMLQKNPELTRIEIENLLKNNADKIGTFPYVDGKQLYYGYGKINLSRIMENIN